MLDSGNSEGAADRLPLVYSLYEGRLEPHGVVAAIDEDNVAGDAR